jgi:hypothetical protein
VSGERRLTELSREESVRLLGTVSLGRVVFTMHAMPAIRPVNHIVDDGKVIIRSHLGAAMVTIAGDTRGTVVAYEADTIDPDSHVGWSVVVTGVAPGTGHWIPAGRRAGGRACQAARDQGAALLKAGCPRAGANLSRHLKHPATPSRPR